MFFGREKEQEVINYLLDSDKFEFCNIYGRRRLGKTALVSHCLESGNVPSILFQCRESNEQENTSMLTKLIENTFSLQHLQFDSFIELLDYLFELSKSFKFCFVMDEYPYIRELIPGCDSHIQALVDKYSLSSKMKLFILGSSIRTMEDVMEANMPLYGRITQSILLKQMDYYESSLFYESFSNTDKVVLYSVFGGVPFYNIQINANESVEQNIIRIISSPYAKLNDFVENHLKSELRKINNANVVFDSIAKGAFHYSDILSKSHIESSSNLNVLLNKLEKMDLIEYVYPMNDKKNKQKSGYRLSDPSTRFYYEFIYPYKDAYAILNENSFYKRFIEDNLLHRFVPECFEKICKEYLIRMNKMDLLDPFLVDVGTYWYDNIKEKRNGQFDIVGKTTSGYIFYECKYRNTPIDDKIIEEEIEQVGYTNLHPIQYGFFSKSGFKLSKKYSYLFYTLDDLYK